MELILGLPLADWLASVLSTALFLGTVLVMAAVLEWRARADMTRYRSRAFLNDLAYALYYRGGIHRVLLFSLVAALLEASLGGLRFGVLTDQPLWLRIVVFWVVGDFVLYWLHRWQHSSRLLWSFHAIHHSQEQLSTLTQYRRHPIDQLFLDGWMFFLFPLVLGLPSQTWLPFYAVMNVLQALQHAELDWRYGPLYPVVVSPTFHAFHHSASPDEHHGNYGFMFSIWDHLFGTAVDRKGRPERYGVDGLEMPETLIGHLLGPFRRGGGAPAEEAESPPVGSEAPGSEPTVDATTL